MGRQRHPPADRPGHRDQLRRAGPRQAGVRLRARRPAPGPARPGHRGAPVHPRLARRRRRHALPVRRPAAGVRLRPVRQPAAGRHAQDTTGNGNYFLRARNYNPSTGRFTSTDPMPEGDTAVSPYTYAGGNPMAYTDPTGTMREPDSGSGGSADPAPPTGDQPGGPSADDVAKAQQLQHKSMLDVILEAGGQILMEILGINDIINCLKGDIGACVMAVIGNLPWGKIFKAKKIAEALWRAGKAIWKFIEDIKWARAILRGAEDAAKAAAAAAAEAAKVAAEKAAAAKALAERLAKKAAEEAEARAKALAAKAKAALKKGSQDAKDAAKGCTHSFAAGTAVLLADGTSKAIDRTQPGDTVLATDPITGQTQARQITRTIRTIDDTQFVDVTVKDAGTGGTHTVTTTEHHPFWSATEGRWVDAGTLHTGELLRTAAGTYVQVGTIRRYESHQATYDLTVDAIHTYYVIAGTTPVLVHNCGPDLSVRDDMANSGMRPGRGGKADTTQAGLEYDKHQLNPSQVSP
ncbi:MAG: hypothetical protein E6G35_05040, partial [Actinobacteria bacterium]